MRLFNRLRSRKRKSLYWSPKERFLLEPWEGQYFLVRYRASTPDTAMTLDQEDVLDLYELLKTFAEEVLG